MALAVRDDNGNYINSSHNGDYYPLTVDAGGKLRCVMTTSTALNVIIGEGSETIGKLAANDGVDIGDVDVKSIVPGTGVTNLVKQKMRNILMET